MFHSAGNRGRILFCGRGKYRGTKAPLCNKEAYATKNTTLIYLCEWKREGFHVEHVIIRELTEVAVRKCGNVERIVGKSPVPRGT
jgi:hypothetical protein